MKLGIFGARADQRGLAYQTLAYADHLSPVRVHGIDMTTDALSPYPCDWDQYDTSNLTVSRNSLITESFMRKWLKGLDVVFGAETFYRDEFMTIARQEGVRTVLHVNPEFCPWLISHDDPHVRRTPVPPAPDVIALPTTWRMDKIIDPVHLPFPVDRQRFPFRLRTKADRFVHVAGHRAAADRAGTRMVMGAMARLRGRVDILIRSQSPLGQSSPFTQGLVEERNYPDPRDLYTDADVIVFPRRYGGNSLVHQEALSSGCPIISLDRAPENTWGGVMTVPTRTRQRLRTKGGMLEVADTQAHILAKVVADLAADPERVERLSREADAYAETISWDALLPMYHDFFKAVIDGEDSNYLRGVTSPLRKPLPADIPITP